MYFVIRAYGGAAESTEPEAVVVEQDQQVYL